MGWILSSTSFWFTAVLRGCALKQTLWYLGLHRCLVPTSKKWMQMKWTWTWTMFFFCRRLVRARNVCICGNMWWKTACFFRSHGGFSLSKLWRPLMHSWPPFYLWANGSRWCCTWMMSVGSPEIRLEVSRDLGDVLWNHSGDLKGFCCVATCYARAAQRTQLLKLLRQGFWSWTKLKPTVRDEHDGKKTKKKPNKPHFSSSLSLGDGIHT